MHYINGATEQLANDIRAVIESRPDLQNESPVIESFTRFDETCRMPPAIVCYVAEKLSHEANMPAFSDAQLEILMLAVIARSSSTYGTIPGVVAHLALIGEHQDAAILNENAKNETGDRAHTPHPILLYDGFTVIGAARGIPALSPASYHIMRHVMIERERLGQSVLHTVEAVKDYFAVNDLHVPAYTDADIRVALHYADRCDPTITHLHSSIIEAESRMNDVPGAAASRNPYDRAWLGVRLLELAMREASSVDEHDTGRLSYIGAWGRVVEHLIPQFPPDQHARARAWTEAHNDEAAGQAVGWEGAAEEGHAEDARVQAVGMLKTLKPATLALVLSEVAEFNVLRLGFWDRVVADLRRLDERPEAAEAALVAG
ncbi:hypothetical protein [Methylobacterium sp. SyP6R]|uniref:hypothetical protein n=1 Tax=Methylobacterium sp. SyP6R TaxID=2718876 RepID=UPI001F2AEB53|nr:hypothetical protein [Methylobacterium sp. SyP6R]MCF4130094.1 hypothetical protein [Methylobacterium sp. SyP6R]